MAFQYTELIQLKKFFEKSKNRKERITKLQMYNSLRRTMRMFKWTGLPEEIPQRYLELSVQTRKYMGIVEHEGKHYCLWGGLGGVPNYNYLPTWFIVANPYLKLSNTYNIYGDNKDCVIIPNDSLYQGMLDTISFHSEILTEIQLTKRRIIINNRMPKIITAPDNNTKRDIDDLLKDVEDGEIASIFDRSFLKDIQSIDNTGNEARNLITQVLEMEQYQKASLFNDLGLQMNYNMKRETITSSEAQLGESALLPLPDDMLETRKIACKEVNEVFGLKWNVEFDSAWADLRKSIRVEMELQEKDLQPEPNEEVQSTVQDTEQSEVVQDAYEKAVNIVEPIIEATKDVIQEIVNQNNEEDNNETT